MQQRYNATESVRVGCSMNFYEQKHQRFLYAVCQAITRIYTEAQKKNKTPNWYICLNWNCPPYNIVLGFLYRTSGAAFCYAPKNIARYSWLTLTCTLTTSYTIMPFFNFHSFVYRCHRTYMRPIAEITLGHSIACDGICGRISLTIWKLIQSVDNVDRCLSHVGSWTLP